MKVNIFRNPIITIFTFQTKTIHMRKFLTVVGVLLIFSISAIAQTKEVTGKITDETGAPIPGATIRLKGKKSGVSADANGTFRINTPGNAILLISGVGFEPQEIAIGNLQTVPVTLKRANTALNEVVVTALGISREKKAISYSTQTVNAETIANGGRANLVDDLNGKVAGVQITNAGGQAGAGTTIVIRGYNSLTGNNQPLYVVDGVPIDNTAEQGSGYAYNVPTANRAIDLNPDDVESLTILKGGAATALYGIQAANGALVITTKKGKNGKINIEAGYGYASATANKFPAFSHGFMRGSNGLYNTATTNNWGPLASSNPVFPQGTSLDLVGTGVPVDVSGQKIPYYPNNYQNFFVTGVTNKYNLAFSGGNDKTTFYAALSRLDQGSIVRNNTYDKTSAVMNITNQLTPRLRIEAKINYINTGGLRFDAGRMMNGLDYYVNTWNITTFPWKDASGQETWWQKTISSPMWSVHETGEHYRLNRYIGNLGFDYKLGKGFSIDYKYGLDNYSESRRNVDPIGTLAYSSTNYLGGMHEVRINSSQINSDLMLNYDHTFSEDFHLHALVGQNIFYKKYDVLDITGSSFVLPQLFDITNTQTQTIYHSSYQKQTLGVYGDVQLGYKDLLFLEGTLRNDWSSTLPRNNDHFLYPSVSLGFLFSELVRQDWLSYGKLRASYAGTANDAPVNALQTAYASVTPTVFANPRFSYPTTVGNPNIKHEHTTQQEVGVDLGFFKKRVFLEATYYSKKSYDQIIYAPTSYATGVTTELINLGETTNKGIDATLSFKDVVKTSGFSWSSAFNFSRNVSNVVKVGNNGNDKVILVGGYNSNAEIDAQKGQPFGAIYGYAWRRYSPLDANGNPTITEASPGYLKQPYLLDDNGHPSASGAKTLLGNTSPKFILGWNNNLSYAHFNFGFTIEWRKGGDVVNDFNDLLSYSGKGALTQNRYYAPGNIVGAEATKTWVGVDATGKSVSVPVQLTKSYYTGTFVSIDENWIEDASWLRLRNVYLGYSFSEKMLKPIHLKGLDITVSGRNVWLHTKYTGIDPEVSSAGSGPNAVVGIDVNSVPATKTWDVAIKLRF
jgi:TonB-linked SusC/RagA family outer membrane protein